jgi:CubicO group peptidase (beta-lactamase class C family)
MMKAQSVALVLGDTITMVSALKVRVSTGESSTDKKGEAQWKEMLVLSVVALSVLLASCGGPLAAPEALPIPVAPVDVGGIALVPYISKDFGMRGVVPDGWIEALPGTFPGLYLSSLPEHRPGTILVQRLEAGALLRQALAAWLPRLGLKELPERSSTRETESFAWDLHTFEAVDSQLGPRKGAIALAETEDGVYVVLLATTPEEYPTLHEMVFLPAVDALSPTADVPSPWPDYAGWPVVASIESVGNNADETIEFTLDRCTPMRIYAIGEGGESGMQDFGYIENVATAQIIWNMYFYETESAGYYRNRRVDRALSLPPGTYRLRFQTNDTHAFADWGDRPPGHRFWGITLFEDPSPEASRVACWERPSRPEDLGWSAVRLNGLVPELERQKVAALMVVTHGQVVFEWGNTANNFRAHSMRKSLLSALYGISVAKGEIDPSQTLQELDIDDLNPLTENEKQATVTDLLRARSGVYIPAAAEAQSMKDARPERGSHKPGAFWYYNNWDFNVLGTIFDQETGVDVFQAFRTRIADPIGMQDFRLEDQHYDYEYRLSSHPAYNFRISARDLARLGQLYLQEGKWNEAQIVPADWVEESTRVHSRTGQTGTSSGYGYMWWIAAEDFGDIKEGSFCASGYGGHTVEVLPHLDTVIVIRVNTDQPDFTNLAGSAVDQLILKILEARRR